MPKRYGKCTNFGGCPIADSHKIIEVNEGDEFNCPKPQEGCGLPLYPAAKPPEKKDGGNEVNWKKILSIGIPLILLGALLIWWLIPTPPPPPGEGSHLLEKKTNDTTQPKPPVLPIPQQCKNDTTNFFSGNESYNYATNDIDSNNSKVKAIIEIGTKRFDYYIIRMNSNKGWVKLKFSLGNKENEEKSKAVFNEKDYEVWKKGLEDYLQEIKDFGHISPTNIHFVISSGGIASSAAKSNADRLQKLGYFVNTVTPNAEATTIYNCVLNNPNATINELKGQAFVVDLGTGNTKIAWGSEADERETLVGAGYKDKDKNANDTIVYRNIVNRLKSLNIPKQATNTCIIVGGLPYQLSRFNSSKERYKSLKSPNTYCAYQIYTDPSDSAKRVWADCGLNIYKAISDATGCTNFIFDGDSQFGIGFLVTQVHY